MNYLDIRESQIVHTHGIGSISNFPGLSLMILSHDLESNDWGFPVDKPGVDVNEKKRIIKDERLCKTFNVDAFIKPPSNLSSNGIKTARFPSSLYCPECGRIHFVKDLEKFNEGYIPNKGKSLRKFDEVNEPYCCTDCFTLKGKLIELIPMRFIIATEDGFIDDFPWDWYVHRAEDKRKFRNTGLRLYISFQGSSASLSDIIIKSKDAHGKTVAKTDLSRIFDQEDTFMRKDDNYLEYVGYKLAKPWLGRIDGNFYKEKIDDVIIESKIPRDAEGNINGDPLFLERLKSKYPRTLQRGANNLYFPVLIKAIRIPTESYKIEIPYQFEKKINNIVGTLKDNIPDLYMSFSEKNWIEYFSTGAPAKNLKNEFGESFETYLEKIFTSNNQDEKEINGKILLRNQEFECFINNKITTSKEVWYQAKHFKPNSTSVSQYAIEEKIDQIVLIEKLNEINVLRGFTRIKPLIIDEFIFDENLKGGKLEEFKRICDVRKKKIETKELPCSEVKGEGIFIQFNNDYLRHWEHSEKTVSRFNNLKKNISNYLRTFVKSEDNYTSARYVMLHTLSHLLLIELANDSGYNLSSLSEIIYCDNGKGEEMNGILIYTSSSDSDGTLGGLVEKGQNDNFLRILSKALEASKWCSSDPLCITSEGQGFMGTNLAACYACTLIPETSCENMNKFLDRKLVLDFFELEY